MLTAYQGQASATPRSSVAVFWLTRFMKAAPGIPPRGRQDRGLYQKHSCRAGFCHRTPVEEEPSDGRLPKEPRVREGWREMDDGEEAELCSVHPHIGFMVDVIDASIRAVITVRDGGRFLITLQYFLLCISRSRDESTKMGNKGGGNPEDLQRQKHKNTSFPHFFQSVLTHRLIVLLGDCADGLLTPDAHQENTYV